MIRQNWLPQGYKMEKGGFAGFTGGIVYLFMNMKVGKNKFLSGVTSKGHPGKKDNNAPKFNVRIFDLLEELKKVTEIKLEFYDDGFPGSDGKAQKREHIWCTEIKIEKPAYLSVKKKPTFKHGLKELQELKGTITRWLTKVAGNAGVQHSNIEFIRQTKRTDNSDIKLSWGPGMIAVKNALKVMPQGLAKSDKQSEIPPIVCVYNIDFGGGSVVVVDRDGVQVKTFQGDYVPGTDENGKEILKIKQKKGDRIVEDIETFLTRLNAHIQKKSGGKHSIQNVCAGFTGRWRNKAERIAHRPDYEEALKNLGVPRQFINAPLSVYKECEYLVRAFRNLHHQYQPEQVLRKYAFYCESSSTSTQCALFPPMPRSRRRLAGVPRSIEDLLEECREHGYEG